MAVVPAAKGIPWSERTMSKQIGAQAKSQAASVIARGP